MPLFYSKVSVKLHWGFSVSVPTASKAKGAALLPPPSTLVGALSYGRFRGVDSIGVGGGVGSPAAALEQRIRVAAARFEDSTVASYIEDVVRNVVSPFQRPGRRAERRYRYNIVPTGKIYSPGGQLRLVYVSDLARDELEALSWAITRLGSKEGLVSVEGVEVGEAKQVQGDLRTKYYFRSDVDHAIGEVQYVDFWEGGSLWGKRARSVRYAVPVSEFPFRPREVKVRAKEAYEVGGEVVVLS